MTTTPRFTEKVFDQVHLESRVFTPGGSRFKTGRIHFKSLRDASGAAVKIFNLHNVKIAELPVINQGNEFLAEWDGKDTQGQLQQGIYIYQIEIDGQAYNGTIVVAR